jgi:hypothetical protein
MKSPVKSQQRGGGKPAQRPGASPARTAATSKSEAKVPARRPSTDVTDLDAMSEADSGAGVSNEQSDNLIPIIYVLQPLSKQVLKKNEQYVDGAEAGMFYMRGAEEPLRSGDDGIWVQPCYFGKALLEWIPRNSGGGLVGRHSMLRGESIEQAIERLGIKAERMADKENPNRVRYVTDKGHELNESREYAVIVHDGESREEYLLPFSGTGHTVARAWMGMIRRKRLPSGSQAPIWRYKYLMTTQYKTNPAGEWYLPSFDDSVTEPVETVDDYNNGKRMHEAFASGAKTVDASAYAEAAGDGDDGPV